jgi:Holliday junction resolvase
MLRESTIERSVCDIAKRHKWLTYKFISPATRGVPDRIFIKGGRVVFIEFKAPGKKPTKLQAHTIAKMQAEGAEVYVCDSVESGCAALSV